MSFVAVNVLTVPEGAGSTLEQRFARRAGSVEAAPGFEHFELLRPLEGTDSYLVYTR
jgi:heme-degrading monooxygenase HmoA